MKRILKITLALMIFLCVFAGLMPVRANAAWITQGMLGTSGLKYKLETDGTLTISGNGAMPACDGVWGLCPWKDYRSSIKKVVIDDGVKSIGICSFTDCTNLTKVIISDSVTAINRSAFSGCKKLTSVTLPDNLTHIGQRAFAETGLTGIKIPKGVTQIGSYAFADCKSLKTANIPGTVEQLYDNIFNGCGKLEKVTIGEGLDELSEGTFSDCKSLKQIEIPKSLRVIDDGAFRNCTGLKEVTIPAGVEYIDSEAFSGCSNVTKIYFKGDVPSIDDDALKKVTAKAYYPAYNDTWTKDKRDDYGGKITWAKKDYKPDAPVVKAENDSDSGKIKVSWKKVPCAAKYQVYRSDSKSGTYTKVKTTTGSSYIDKTAEAGTKYYYKVRAVSGGGLKSSYSNVVAKTCDLARPEIEVTNVHSSGRLKIQWQPVEGAVKYKIYRSYHNSENYQYYKSTTKTSYTDKDTKGGTKYFYKVVAVHSNSTANSAKSAGKGLWCKLAQPEVEESNVAASGKIKLEWQSVEGATKYAISRRVGKSGEYMNYATTTSTAYTDENTEPGVVYYYKVRAVCKKANGNSVYSDKVGQTCDLPRPEVEVSIDTSPNGIKLEWKNIDGAVKYKIYRAAGTDGDYTYLGSTKDATYVDADIASDTTYSYKVKAVHSNSGANSAYSSIDSIKAK